MTFCHFEMVKGDDIYLIRSETFNCLHLNPEIIVLQNYESCPSQWELFIGFGHTFVYSNNQLCHLDPFAMEGQYIME